MDAVESTRKGAFCRLRFKKISQLGTICDTIALVKKEPSQGKIVRKVQQLCKSPALGQGQTGVSPVRLTRLQAGYL